MGKTIIQTITDNLEPDNENGKLSAKQLRGINAAGTQYESGIYKGFGNDCRVTVSETPLSFDINTGMFSAGGLICEIQEPETISYGSGTNGQYALLVATVNLVDDTTATVKYEILKGSTSAYPTYTQQNMTYGESGITQVPIVGFKYDGVGTAGLTTSQNKYFIKNWGTTLDTTTALANANKTALAGKADASTLNDYVKRRTTGTNLNVNMGAWNGDSTKPLFIQSYINSAEANTIRMIQTFPEGDTGVYITPDFVNHMSNGAAKTLAYKSDISDVVKKAIGTSSKSVTIGELTSGGQMDFQIYHDMDAQNLSVRRMTGDDKHGFYSNEADGHMYVYLGNKSDARKIANSVDLTNYVMKDDNGDNSYIKFADYNGGTTTPFYVNAYINTANKKTVKLANTFPNGEQGIYIQEGEVSHIDAGATKSLAYDSEVLHLTGGNLTGLLTSDHNINTTANINGKGIATADGRFTSNGTSEGLVHVGTSSTAAQDVIACRYPDNNKRLLLRADTATAKRLYLTSYPTGGGSYNGGIVCQDDFVMHVFNNGDKIIGLAHLTDLTKSLRPIAEVVEAQTELITEITNDPNMNLSKSASRSLAKLQAVGSSLTQALDEQEAELEQYSEQLKAEFAEQEQGE